MLQSKGRDYPVCCFCCCCQTTSYISGLQIRTLGMLRSRFQSLPGAFNGCLIPKEKGEAAKKKGLKATLSRKFDAVRFSFCYLFSSTICILFNDLIFISLFIYHCIFYECNSILLMYYMCAKSRSRLIKKRKLRGLRSYGTQ